MEGGIARTLDLRPRVCKNSDILHPSDFADVFGGPPRSVFLFDFPSHSSRSSSEECPSGKSRRSLQQFQWSHKQIDEFYSDIFSSDNASWVRCDELSPNCGWRSCSLLQDKHRKNCNKFRSYVDGSVLRKTYSDRYSSSGVSGRASSPESASRNLSRDVIFSASDRKLNSHLSALWSFEEKDRVRERKLRQNGDETGCGDDDAISEAVAWAKEKFMGHTSGMEQSMRRKEGQD